MRYFYDTEFIEDGSTIELISIGIVAEDGREYYAVSTDFNGSRANPWVRENVLEKLPNPSSPEWKPLARIREEVHAFLTPNGTRPELWAWVGAYDHVVFAQMWGDMTKLPKDLPRFTRELKQYWEMAGRPKIPPAPKDAHDALVDARHNLIKFRACNDVLPLDRRGRITRPE
ncbi:polyadenylate-specific 3'-exoribonuclease AS [Corynebacterium genitalium ATCC 33030]|uniref:3'-5' exoribonuclease n=1 Tax=Corynebacterium genitalium ATCC 33030 TaxID=585529 RepID=D7WEK5_9CORY|nr:polyadenylate-specific 3'-exoribonuclease AS [Corynebacterium genitalium]MCQ4617827.1 polyadenylate-specific 3'-exoribonuclease AS [Corynebacterium pseudogenitalium]MCQ4620757.1 polyadenylate-specific 3'-exoribonuclease AS [Corynebacterium sp. CCUG 71335]MCQ4622721.1 polyadenylate-specific 3'-exoribonuclease AS [Corynebacterium sp. CCUG 70398]MCQ4624573.1 polyadenylate-specific 3'-exoribonuclease AS [Corynebacterium sp. CCUG 69979]MCQ4626594.1 polyadenylate-specific 3'-exoribonuclease AS [C